MFRLLDKKITLLLIVAFIIQMLTAWHTYFFHSDEYFQIIEFASYKLGITSSKTLPWEFSSQIRPAIQPYLFVWFYQLMTVIGIANRFVIFSLIHILVGIIGFVLCNYLIIKKFYQEKYLFILLLLTNFLGIIPFLRCSFSAEAMGGLTLLFSILILERSILEKTLGWSLLAGLIMGFSFFFRFQVAFSLLGLGLWVLITNLKAWEKIIAILIGFLIGSAINMYLDASFYGKFCFTPYNYYYANIVLGKAAAFGTSPWWYYIAILAALTVPLLSFGIFGLFAKSLANFKNPYAIAMLFFVVGHSMVGHKEERFVFPVLYFIVYLAAEGYRSSIKAQQLISNIWKNKYYGWFIKGGVAFSVSINLLFVILLSIEPYKQPVQFIREINNRFVNTSNQPIVCYRQSPYTTESNLEYHFLSENKLQFTIVKDKATFLNTIHSNPQSTTYYCIKYEDAMNDGLQNLVKNKEGIVSSKWLWSFANWMGEKYHVYIPDMWLLSNG